MTTIPPNPEEALVTISTPESDTVRVKDRVESSRFEFYFDEEVEIEVASTDHLYFPVDTAARFVGNWTNLRVPLANAVCVHDHETGSVIQRVTRDTPEFELGPGQYEMEVMPAPMKVFLSIEGSVTVRVDDEHIAISVEADHDIIAGVRSPHKRPAGTITTTSDPRDLMRATSHLGSALKTTSPERSWPTLRGYPPYLEQGSTLSIPSSISRPEVDVQLEIPYDLESVFLTAPLAYYTAAEVVPVPTDDSVPALVAAGERIRLPGNLGEASASLLQRNVLLDSVVRSEGIYPFETHERKEVEDHLPWDPDTVYDLPLGDRIAAYEAVPDGVLESIHPTWPLTIDIAATAQDIPAITHIAEELAVVRVPKRRVDALDPRPEYLSEFIRSDGSGNTASIRATEESVVKKPVSRPEPWGTQIHTSLLEHYPLGSNKTTVRAFERHIEREAPDTDIIEVNVVCNDDEMREEDVVTEFYGVRDLLEFDVNIHYNLSTEAFQGLLSETFDLIHYIGHVDDAGVKCPDGYLDIRTDVTDVGFDAFLLNACRSVEQGEALLDAGAAGGIATLYDVPNSSATIIGRTLSRLLNRGFTIRSALEIARDVSYLGDRWVSLGDGRVSLTQAESVVPNLVSVTPCEDGYELEVECFETDSHRIGTLVWPNADWGDNWVLPSSRSRKVTEKQLKEFFSLEVVPIKVGTDIYWTDEISPAELREQYEN